MIAPSLRSIAEDKPVGVTVEGRRLLHRLRTRAFPIVSEFCHRAIDRGHEALRRIGEAVRDTKHRLQTGRPRGIPPKYAHPPLDCSSGCSLAARRVHGLLYGYSLAYAEVRPKAETIAATLGYGRSTVYNATAELRQAGLIAVHDRHGSDRRRLSSRYDVFDRPMGTLLDKQGGPSEVENGHSKGQRTRTRIENLEKSKRETTTSESACGAKPDGGEVGGPARSSIRTNSISEDHLGEVVGLDRLRALRKIFGGELGKLRVVIAKQGATTHPHRLRAACDALLKGSDSIDNPAGYLRGILRHQQHELDGVSQELAELEERHRQAVVFGDENRLALESRLRELKAAQARVLHPRGTHVAKRAALSNKRNQPIEPPSRCDDDGAAKLRAASNDRRRGDGREGVPEVLAQIISRLDRSNSPVARIVREELEPCDQEKHHKVRTMIG